MSCLNKLLYHREELTGTIDHLTLYRRCRWSRCRYSRARQY